MRPAVPRRQSAHSPHDGAHDNTTSSPTATPPTPSPTASTTPEPSWPSTIGVGRSHSPFTMWRSVPQMPTAAMRTSTCPGPGSSSSMSFTVSGRPTSQKTAARDFTRRT